MCRGFAALAVFWRHSAGGLAIAGTGATAVSFFFILSGFVLEWSATRAPADRPTAFYWRRFARIYPAYALSILVGYAYYWHVYGSPTPLRTTATNLFLIQSWVPNSTYYYALNGVAWSLSCEAFFYLLFPMLRRAFRSLTVRGAAVLAVACVAINLTVVTIVHDPAPGDTFGFWLIYIFPGFRILEFIAGMLLARMLIRRPTLKIPPLPALGLAVAAFVLCSNAPQWAQWSTVTFVPYAVLILALASSDAASPTRSRAWLLVKLGEWSYAFYLFHQLVLKISSSIVGRTSSHLGLKVVLIDLAIALVVSASVYELYERPAETKLRSMWRTRYPAPSASGPRPPSKRPREKVPVGAPGGS